MTYLDIPLPRLAVAFALVLVAILVSMRMGLHLTWALLVGAVRGAVQLLAVGYLLVLLFAHQQPASVLGLLAVMLFVAAWTSASRVEHGPGLRVLLPRSLAAIVVGSSVALVPIFVLVLHPSPWFDARYLVPLSGMIVANAMNVVAQVQERIFASTTRDGTQAQIEQLLALGATSRQALGPEVTAAVRAALIPTLNGLLTVGLVALPGMMTGQILSGTAPDHAIRYQIIILYQLVVVAAVSGSMAAYFARRVLFTKWDQLVVRRDG